MNRGSEFRKWDLHIHSPYTILNNQFDSYEDGKPKIDEFIQKIKAEGISAIGLTNYFMFKNEDFDLKRRLTDEGIATFLNLEVRLSNINNSNQVFDYHVIFDNTLDDKLVKNLLGSLKAKVDGSEKDINTLTPKEIKESATVSFDALISALKNKDQIKGRYLTGFLSRGHGHARTKIVGVYEDVCANSDFIIHSSCDNPSECKDPKCSHNNLEIDRNYWLKDSKYIRPLLQSSDAHSLEQIGKKYSWIKSDLTFEGLKQIKYEPEYRISLQKDKPTLEKDELVIDRVGYLGEEIYLSENLNAIIGGRSTGKSTLLNSIAKKQVSGIEENMYTFEDIDNFHVVWKDQKEDNNRNVHYIPQEYMYSLAKDNSKLKILIRDIIQQKEDDLHVRRYEQNCSNLQHEIQTIFREYNETKRIKSELIKPEADREATLERINALENKKLELLKVSDISEDEQYAFDELNQKLYDCDEAVELRKRDLEYLDVAYITNIELMDGIIQEESALAKIKLDQIVNNLNEYINREFSSQVEKMKLELKSEIQSFENDMTVIKQNDLYVKCIEHSNRNKELLKVMLSIKSESEVLSQIDMYNKKIIELTEKENKLKKDIILKYKQYPTFRKELQDSFCITEDGLIISVNFSLKSLDDEFEYISGRGNSRENFFNKLRSEFEQTVDNLFDDDSLSFNRGWDKQRHIENFFSTNLYSYYYDVEYQGDKFEQMSPGKKAFIVLKLILDFSDSRIPVLIDQPEDSLDNRAIFTELTAYIKKTKLKRQVILVTHNPNIVVGGDCENIIVANQKSDKYENQNGRIFDYVNGALESSKCDSKSKFLLQKYSIREHVCDILEGGQVAFLKRESKYNLKEERSNSLS